MSFDLQIREHISRYCAGQIDAAALETWLSAATWDIDNEPRATRQLAFDALRFTSEAANGDWTDQELRLQLARLCGLAGGHSASGDTRSPVTEGFLEKLPVAQKRQEHGSTREADQLAAIMRYAHLGASKVASFGKAQSNDRGFLHQPRAESDTRPQPPKELAIG